MKPHVTRTTNRDDYCTPDEFWTPLNSFYRFNLDAAANCNNAKLYKYFSEKENDAMACGWGGWGNIWCNPPFSNKELFLARGIGARNTNGVTVFLLPANARETDWWGKYVRAEADEIITLTPRVNFELDGKRGPGAGFASCLAIYYPRIPGVVYGPPRESVWRWK